VFFALIACVGVLFSSGCQRTPAVPDRVILETHMHGNNQAVFQGEELPAAIRVVVEGPQEPGLLGGKGTRRSVREALVRFEVESPENGTIFSANGEPVLEVMTDSGGMAKAAVRLGNSSGDVLIHASLPDFPDIDPVAFRAVSGMRFIGRDLEAHTGETVDEVGVQLQDADGTPAAGVDVYFRAEDGGAGASVKPSHVVTDSDGRAVTDWKLGKDIKQYRVTVEVKDRRPELSVSERFNLRSVQFVAMATNAKSMLVVLIGGLAVFIFGMSLMSRGLQRLADRRLRSVLRMMTNNRFLAVGAGALITAMVQSSSATTVMTVGFVNAGLMTLKQAVGVVFGANIGTTITAQIIAFKLNDLSYPAIALGMVLMMVSKSRQFRATGQAILGFGLLFLGMDTMSGILKPLRHSPEFISWFHMFECAPGESGFINPGAALMCILIGTITTVVVQSSSATVGLVLALASQGLLSFYTAVPLILGDNIGTTITANLSAIGTNRNARRTALAHTLFNVLGAAYMYVLLFVPLWNGQPVFLGLVDAFTPGDVFAENPENLVRHVANAHTVFNIMNVVLFIGFTGLMARICERVIPEGVSDRESVLQYLEPKLLATPSIALQQAVNEVEYMVRKGQKSLNESCELICGGPASLEAKVLEREELIDRLQKEITEYLVDLSRRDLDSREAATIPLIIHMVNDAERLGDHAEEIVGLHGMLVEREVKLSPQNIQVIRDFQRRLDEEFNVNIQAMRDSDLESVKRAMKIHEEIRKSAVDITDRQVNGMNDKEFMGAMIFLDILVHLERVSDHLLNIAERVGKVNEVTQD
jgi:Na/Pi-cotransporter